MASSPSNLRSTTLAPGDKLDKYQIIEQVGAGGSSVVFKGYDALLDRTVAIKQLLPFAAQAREEGGGIDEAFIRRCREEVALHRKVSQSHKRIVQVLDFIDEPRGAFIVMEFVEGQTLEQLLARAGNPLKPSSALWVIHSTARMLDAIHGQGIIHRDLKPSNLLLARPGGVRLCDLGLASLIAEQEAMSVGSVRYMAPELFKSGPADARADLYSLGMIAYEMLAGRRRFDEVFKTVLRDQRNHAVRWMKWHTNPRLKAAPLVDLNPAVSRVLAELVERMMEKDPAKRIASAQQLLDAIERHFGTGDAGPAPAAVPAAPLEGADGQVTDTTPLPTRRKWPWIVAAAVVAGSVAGFGIMQWFEQARDAARHLATAKDQLRAADVYYQSGELAQAAALYEQIAGESPDSDGPGHVGRAGVMLVQARIDLEAGRYDEARERLVKVDAMDVFRRDMVLRWIDESESRAAFAKDMARIESHIDAAEFGDARQLLLQWRRVTLTPEEAEFVQRLDARFQDQLMQKLVDEQLEGAGQLLEGGRRDDAIDQLTRAHERYGGLRLAEVLDQLKRDRMVDEAVARAAAAQIDGKLEAAIEAYGHALRLRPNDELAEKLRGLKSRAAIEQGRRLLEAGDQEGAQAAFTRALGFVADDAEANRWLARMESVVQKHSHLAAGDKATASGEFESAVNHYQSAMAVEPHFSDDKLVAKLTSARVRLLVERGGRYTESAQFDKATAMFTAAGQLEPAAPGVVEGLARLEQRRTYHRHVTAGDGFRRQSRFRDAKLEYRRAREVLDRPDVRQRLEDVEFDHLIAQARSYIAAEQWVSARALLRTAAHIRQTELVIDLLRQVDGYENEEPADGDR